jgi:hypothetical protein
MWGTKDRNYQKENSKAVRAFERLSPEELRLLMGEMRPVEVKG